MTRKSKREIERAIENLDDGRYGQVDPDLGDRWREALEKGTQDAGGEE
jgi:hypothetical protein